MARGVDKAMKAERPEKATIRKLWYEFIQKYDDENDLIFFTLSGAEGLDVKHLISDKVMFRILRW